MAGLASTRTYPLRSSFRPGYNMTINLVDQLGATRIAGAAGAVLRAVPGRPLGRRTGAGHRTQRGPLAEYQDTLGGADGEDFAEYVALRERIRARERMLERQGREDRAGPRWRRWERCGAATSSRSRRGAGRGWRWCSSRTADTGDPRPLVLTEDKWAGRISVADFPTPAEALGRMRLPRHVDHRTARSRRDLASALRSTGITAPRGRARRGHRTGPVRTANWRRCAARCARTPATAGRIASNSPARGALQPGAARDRLAAAEGRGDDELAGAHVRSDLSLFAERGYIARGADGVAVTDAGRSLARIYTESDLLVAECLRDGAWRGLGPAELAAVVSAVVYESRSEVGLLTVAGPTEPIRRAIGATVRMWSELRSDEARHKLPPTREPDLGFVTAVWKWARGEALVESLIAGGDKGDALSAGDFVRWCRQVIDLLDQLRAGANDPVLAETAAKAVRAIRRGVVAVDAA